MPDSARDRSQATYWKVYLTGHLWVTSKIKVDPWFDAIAAIIDY